MRPLSLFAVLAFLVLPVLALAQAPALDPDSIEQVFGAALQALALPGAARWVVLSLLAVIAGVWVVRRLARGRSGAGWLWVASDEGGTVLKWLASLFVAGVTQALAGGAVVTWKTALVALGLGAAASLRTDWRRLLRSTAPLARLVSPKAASLLELLGGASSPAASTSAAPPPAAPPGT